MNFIMRLFPFLWGLYLANAGYGIRQIPQSDVQAPSYVPPDLRGQQFTKPGYYGTKSTYTGTKTGYGTKSRYAGTKTGQWGTKSTYTNTKSSYAAFHPGQAPGPSAAYILPKQPGQSGYSEHKTWHSYSGSAPSYTDFLSHANEVYKPKCEPECKNNGICVDTNTCRCPVNFGGTHCEFEKKPCLTYPPLPMNSHRKCSPELCTITCMEGFKFRDASTVANMRCNEGQWQPTRVDFTSIPDCEPQCSPPCLNGGVCLALNTCQCPHEFRGPQCQYSTSVCDVRKLAFNGGYNCSGDGEKFSCHLSCPTGSSYSTPPADVYTCSYSTGVFLPQPIPHCVFDEVVVITPSNPHSMEHTFYETLGTKPGGSHYGVKSKPVEVVVQDFTPKGGTCLTWAGSHYKTFDGKTYSFRSSCEHILVRDAKEHKYTVTVKHTDCNRQAYCPVVLTVYLEDKPYTLSIGEDLSVEFRSTKRLIPIPASLPGIRVQMPQDQVLVNLDGLGVTIKWDTTNLVLVEGSVLLWNNTEGLCGQLDGNSENDLRTKEGTIARTKSVMASSWQVKKIGEVCESSPTEVSACANVPGDVAKQALHFCSNVFSKDKFRKCSKVMDVSLLLEACQWDYCACIGTGNAEDCACSTVSVYAKECLRQGVEDMRSWRDPETCPMQCPEGKLYHSCWSDAQPSCAFPLVTATPSNTTCVEGCFCPEGLLMEGGRCVPKEECPCRLRNKVFPPGSVLPKECNTCTCQAGEWTCTQVACGARCSAVGDPHYTTFDGLRYDFMGHCTYTLLKTDNMTINVENVACSGTITEQMNLAPYHGEGKPSCTKAVNLAYAGASIHLKQGGFILVNGKEVSTLPVHVGDILIRAASSLFLIVQMPDGVDLWWDGNTRVFVDVPPRFQDKTRGLCGTFNLNQKDDFLTPEGDVEQSALAFANKWKTREFCEDVEAKEPEHPCKANMENKDAAERYCNKLKSKVFESCHWHVDVEAYYEECLYDMCACAGDLTRCLCPILGDYAMACARAGVMIQWRYNVEECKLSCTGGQEYTVCADSCQRTCSDVALSVAGHCKPSCVEGCACPPGQVLDANNVCVPVGLCPCFHKGIQFVAGYKEVRPGRRERELCTCVGARWDCKPATTNDIQNYPPAEDLMSNCSAVNHMEFTTCELAEPLTCKNMHLPPSTASAECRPGCQCKRGYVLDATTKKCVLASQCPCHHGGRSYSDGHQMQEECNQCVCQNGNWSCSARKCSGVCTAWGDSHVATFDGAEYDFQGVCTYLLAKGNLDGSDGFQVEIQNVPCGTTGATCSKSVTLRIGSGATEEVVSLTKDAALPDISALKRIKLRIAGTFVYLDVPSLGMSLQWDRGMRVYVKVDAMWQNRVKGLCGNYNADMRDDFQTPSGGDIAESSVLIFADSWKLKPSCPKPEAIKDHCQQRPERKEWASSVCGALKRHPFTLCHSEVPVGAFVDRCERDACACDAGDDCACACTALAAYADRCAARGVTFKWRTKERCPMQCDDECSNYDECVSACPLESCDNTLNYAEIKTVCEQDTCVEGCKPKKSCPEGTIYKNSTSTECVPRVKCRPACMTLPDGREILEGEVIEEDACHTCRCSKKEKICTGLPCSTEVPFSTLSTGSPSTMFQDAVPPKCTPGWTEWINKGAPTVNSLGESMEVEPLPNENDSPTGKWGCKRGNMTDIGCRTVVNHQSPKETGLDVECSLERGLVCRETKNVCPDFEVRVFCKCENEPRVMISTLSPTPGWTPSVTVGYVPTGSTPWSTVMASPRWSRSTWQPTTNQWTQTATTQGSTPPISVEETTEPFQCLNADHPNYPHPTDCSMFYECTPDALNPTKLHTVLKSCAPGLMYNPTLMICDWPASVIAVRPECGIPPVERDTTPSRTTGTTPSAPTEVPEVCTPGQFFSECAYPCDKLCDSFKKTLQAKGRCGPGEKCVEGCVNNNCFFGSVWRDPVTCVLPDDCTCLYDGKIVKPNDAVTEGCRKCQCLKNELHCDTSDCTPEPPLYVSTYGPKLTPPSESLYVPSTSPLPSEVPAPTGSTPTLPTESSTHIIKTTVSPPPECSPDGYINLMWGDQPLPDEALTASSVANALFEPQFAKLNGNPLDVTAGSWNPQANDTNPYIQVELPRREPIYGVWMQGSPLFDQYVTSYEVLYGDDGHTFSIVNGPDDKPKVFRGPIDHENPMKQMIEPPIEAKFIRIHPLSSNEEISVRMELIGCKEPISTTTITTTITTLEPLQCTEPLGLAAELPIERIQVSSNSDGRRYFELDGDRGWKPLYSMPGEWIMFDFTSPRNITGIKTKGGPTGWVTSYNIMYTSDLSTFNPVVDQSGDYKMFPANFDQDNAVMNEFRPPIHARYLKVLPLKWKDAIEMRVEPIGCFEPYNGTSPSSPPTSWTTPVAATCDLCPGVPDGPCVCSAPTFFDGEKCVSRDQCPCVEGLTSYVVGSTFRGQNCDECICKLGGVADCKPVTDCKCAPDLVPKLSQPSCECLCGPCKNGTKICLTSKLCLALERWCDGLQDCPDDERDCGVNEPTVVTTVVPTVVATAVTITTTPKPGECPKVECPPGYSIHYTSRSHSSYTEADDMELPPPRPRKSYQRYHRGGYSGFAKGGGYSKTGFSKTGYFKGGFSKGGYSGTSQNQAFTLMKPSVVDTQTQAPPVQKVCPQFKCVPPFRPPPGPGSTVPPNVCSTPICPPRYSLKIESVSAENECPLYDCVPPPERPVYCNITGRTITTFDSTEYKLDLCYHILARENRLDTWTVLVRKKCTANSCLNELIVRQDDQLILVKPNLMIEYNNYEYTVEQTVKICFQKNSFDLNKLGNGLSIKSRIYNFTVFYTPDGDIKIGALETYMGAVDGLCGSFDGEASNDRQLPDGSLARSIDEFGRAWAKPGLPSDACRPKVLPPPEKPRISKFCDIITKQPLTQCDKVLNLDKWRTICVEKVLECSDQVVNGTKRTEEECRCALLEQLVAECLAADKNIDLGPWRIQMDCPSDCPPPLVHYDCYRKRCEPTCSELGSQRSCPTEDGHCYPGCYCPEGKLRKGDECVAPDDCHDCVCDGVSSPAKYVTFERDDLPFGGNCTYLASRDRNETGYHKYQVYATNGPCENNKAAVCTKIVHLLHGRHVVHISKDLETNKLLTTIDGSLVFKYPVEKDWAKFELVKGQDISVLVHEASFELTVLQAKLQFSVRVPSHVYANRTQGLCGVCAGYQQHLTTSNGTATDNFEEYGISWKATPEALQALDVVGQTQCDEPAPPIDCVRPPPEQNPCYALLNSDKFGECHPLVDPQSYLVTCEEELCALNSSNACPVLERYAAECRQLGVCLNWRTDACPYPCEAPFVYDYCVDCEKTCDNNEKLEADPQSCRQQLVEGCFCPEGKVRVNNTCIEPKKCFPCDANKEHYAGDQWQEDACTKCTCSKLAGENSAHVSCTVQSCAVPICSDDEDRITKDAKTGECCSEYICVRKPENSHCVEAKKMECGFGQVLKQKTKSDGCTEYVCECKPASECEQIPSSNEVEILEPGIERLVDSSGCCPRLAIFCRPETCPPAPDCPPFYNLRSENVTGKCCPQHKCELPKDQCVVNLEWEAAAKGGEQARSTPQVVLKDMDSVWLDGPCRSCQCSNSSVGAVSQCSVTECPPVTSTDQFVLEPRLVPFACCPEAVQVACRVQDTIYKIGENWTSANNPCQSYKCEKLDDGSLEKVTTMQTCDVDCQPGWKYKPAETESRVCCGECEPVACIVDGVEHKIGERWTSEDFCTNYTCVNDNGALHVQSADETCEEISDSKRRQFEFRERRVSGKCCSEYDQVACRVGNKTYQVGESWPSATDVCTTVECTRQDGKLEKVNTVMLCDEECQSGWEYFVPGVASGKCCGECKPVSCVVDGKVRNVGERWTSDDFCTNYTCADVNGTIQVQTANETCPEISEALKKQFVYEEKKVPGKCCSVHEQVACRVDNVTYQPGENWTSPVDPCVSYTCSRADGKLERVTTVRGCDEDCQPGWKFFPAPADSGECCGSCKPVSCVVEGEEHNIGEKWTSDDFCTNYTCADVNGTLHVQSADETCEEISESKRRQFEYRERRVPGKCCSEYDQVACRVGNKTYQVGESWPSSTDVCTTVECTREDGKLEKVTTVMLCDEECQPGWEYFVPGVASGKCCGECKPVSCVVDGKVRNVGERWTSEDFCTNYTCADVNGTMQVQTANETCSEISEALKKQFLYQEKKVPGKCCTVHEQVACRVDNVTYQPGENWTSPVDPCVSYTCSRADGKLERVTTVRGCDEDCQPGWKYFPASADSGECCGSCKPVSCVVDGEEHNIGEKWTSDDFCTNYTCVDVNGTLQVQSSDETCPEISDAMKKQYVYEEKKVPGKCCSVQEPVACRVGNDIYQEGQTWPSDEPCRNVTCERDVSGRLTHASHVETCTHECQRGWRYELPPPGQCCGHCVQDACVVDDEIKPPGSTWKSADNCTTYSCDRYEETVCVTSAREVCPDVSDCTPEELINETCCQVCPIKSRPMKKCEAESIQSSKTVGMVRLHTDTHGLCINKRPMLNLKECRGVCESGTTFNNQSTIFDSKCECCQAVKITSILVDLTCEDGSMRPHRVAVPETCACQSCGGSAWPTKTRPTKSGTKTFPTKTRQRDVEYTIPEIYERFGESAPKPPR